MWGILEVGWDVGVGGEVVHREEEDGNTAPLCSFYFATMTAEERDSVYYTRIGTKALWGKKKEKKEWAWQTSESRVMMGGEENTSSTLFCSLNLNICRIASIDEFTTS